MAAVLMGGMVLAGCDDNVEVLRDPDIRVAKGMTWAWRPIAPPPPQSAALCADLARPNARPPRLN